MGTLSMHPPTRDKLCRMLAAISLSRKILLVYCHFKSALLSASLHKHLSSSVLLFYLYSTTLAPSCKDDKRLRILVLIPLSAICRQEAQCLLPCCIPFVLKIPPVSVFQSRNRDDKNTVGTDICRIGEPADDTKNRRSNAPVLLNIVAK